jgi:ferredoxin
LPPLTGQFFFAMRRAAGVRGGGRKNPFAISVRAREVGVEPNEEAIMPHVVTNKCVGCKFTDCVEVCPVACFYELDKQVVIHPEDCIDCTACVEVCPVEAIYAEENLPAEFKADTEFNAAQARQSKDSGREAIVKKKDPLPTAAERRKALGY